MTDAARLARLEQSVARIELTLKEISEATNKNNQIAAKLGEFIWVLERVGAVFGSIQDTTRVGLLSDEADP